ncbi:MAG: trypsin-like peptidase domain-containing protein [Planctomycetaceae bacterium]
MSTSEGVADQSEKMADLLKRRDVMAFEQEMLDAEIERFAIESICGPTDDTQDVEKYDGTRGVTRQFVDTHERPVGQLQWLDDLAQRFSGPNNSPGDVAGVRWGTGGLIANDLYITAGHCFDANGGGWVRPIRNGVTIAPDEIATLMQINFVYQVDGASGQVRPGDPFPVVALLEHRVGGLDFAIARVGKNAAGKLPGEIYGVLPVAAADLTLAGSVLCMIQHPSGRPKRVDAGPMLRNVGGKIEYNTLDTEGGSSGAPILSPVGELAGVHTNGGCSTFSGANYGVAIGAIRNASSIVN